MDGRQRESGGNLGSRFRALSGYCGRSLELMATDAHIRVMNWIPTPRTLVFTSLVFNVAIAGTAIATVANQDFAQDSPYADDHGMVSFVGSTATDAPPPEWASDWDATDVAHRYVITKSGAHDK